MLNFKLFLELVYQQREFPGLLEVASRVQLKPQPHSEQGLQQPSEFVGAKLLVLEVSGKYMRLPSNPKRSSVAILRIVAAVHTTREILPEYSRSAFPF